MKRKLWIILAVAALLGALCCGVALADASGSCGNDVTWAFDPGTGTLTISGTGPMTDSWTFEAAPWAIFRSDIRSVVIHSGVTTIGRYAFYGCSQMTSITIPNRMTRIGLAAFTNCMSLPGIIIPHSVTSIGNYAFSTCKGLTSVSILNPDCRIGGTDYGVFNACSDSLVLRGWTGSTTETYAQAAGHQFVSMGVLSGACGSNLTWTFNPASNELTISGTGTMDDYPGSNYPGWYAHRENVTSVSIGNGVTYIGEYAFYNMSALEQVTIGSSVTGIGSYAFQNCPNLTEVTVPSGVTAIGNGGFRECSSLTRATILNPDCAFGSSVFTNCSPALDLCGWSDSTAETYAGASLGFVSLGSISGACGDNVAYSFNPVNQILTISGTGPMADYSDDYPDWNEYRDFVSGVIVQNGVTSVGPYAFYSMSNLTMAVVGNSVTRIGLGAYRLCERLTGITLPESVTSIDDLAFSGCTALTSVTIRHPECEIGETSLGVFTDTSADLVLRGWPGSTAEACAQAEGYGFESLGTISGPCGDNVTWAFNPGTGRLTISGTGAMADYGNDTPGWYEYNYYITEIFVAEGVTSIGAYAFQMSSVTSAVLSDSLTSIGSRAFNQCSALYGLVIPQNVTSIGSYAFSMCSSLTSVIIKNPDCAIGSGSRNVFMLCPSLVLTGWPGSTAEAYAQAAGHGFESLGTVLNLPANLTTIEAEAFAGVQARAVRIPGSVTSIAGNAFTGSTIAYVFGVPGSAAQAFADSHYNYFFVPVAD